MKDLQTISDSVLEPTDQTDLHVVRLWLHGRPQNTLVAYQRDLARFNEFVVKGLREVTLGDIQAFADSLTELSPATQARHLATVKSLIGFAHKLGYLPFDVGRAVKIPRHEDRISERFLSESEVHAMFATASTDRDRLLLRLLYYSGCRLNEIAQLSWRNVQSRETGGQISVYGKGSKTRIVRLPEVVFQELEVTRNGADPDEPVFVSRNGGRLSPGQIANVVRQTATRAGIQRPVSPHWLRHAHATHSLERGAPIHLVAATLGHTSVATTGRYLHARPSDSSGNYLAT